MSKKFYLVKNEINASTGGFIPYKVLNYYPSIIQPVPIPIKKTSGLSIPLGTPNLPAINYGSPYFNAPQVSLTGKPIPSQFISAINPLMYTPTLGAPIIKYNLLAQHRTSGLLKIMIGSNIISINIPHMYFRKVINDIYYKAFTDIDETEPKISIVISGPGINTTIKTTLKQILKIIRYIEKTYGGLTYAYNGINYGYNNIYNRLI